MATVAGEVRACLEVGRLIEALRGLTEAVEVEYPGKLAAEVREAKAVLAYIDGVGALEQ